MKTLESARKENRELLELIKAKGLSRREIQFYNKKILYCLL